MSNLHTEFRFVSGVGFAVVDFFTCALRQMSLPRDTSVMLPSEELGSNRVAALRFPKSGSALPCPRIIALQLGK